MAAQKKPSHQGVQAFFTLSLIKLVGLLPLPAARALGSFFARLSWYLQDRSSRVTLQNLALCYPEMNEPERRQLAKESVLHTGMLAAEICVIRNCSPQWLDSKIVKVEGETMLREQIAKGKGLILLAPHLGNWEILSLVLVKYGKLTALYQPPKQAYLEPLIKAAREKTGATLVPTTPKGLAKLLLSLRSGGITAVLPDQNPGRGNGVFSPFFNVPAYTMTTVHAFLRRTQCAVVMGFVKRVHGGFEIYYLPAPEAIYSEDIDTSVAALNRGVQDCIAYCPEQYQWEYKRFKRVPEGVEPRY